MVEENFGNTVKVHYTVKLEDGTVVDSSLGHEPFMLTIGMGQAIPGFEKALMDMKAGESKTVKVEVDDAYGPHYEELVTEVERSQFPSDFAFEVGQHLEMPRPDGQYDLLTVLKVTEKTVILDSNHPLAGKNLIIDIQLLEIL